jgi:hypothetical protein
MALHVNWAQASQVQIPSVVLDAWIQGTSVQCSRCARPLRQERLEIVAAVAHQVLTRAQPTIAF